MLNNESFCQNACHVGQLKPFLRLGLVRYTQMLLAGPDGKHVPANQPQEVGKPNDGSILKIHPAKHKTP